MNELRLACIEAQTHTDGLWVNTLVSRVYSDKAMMVINVSCTFLSLPSGHSHETPGRWLAMRAAGPAFRYHSRRQGKPKLLLQLIRECEVRDEACRCVVLTTDIVLDT